jgi:hypothetical protein
MELSEEEAAEIVEAFRQVLVELIIPELQAIRFAIEGISSDMKAASEGYRLNLRK